MKSTYVQKSFALQKVSAQNAASVIDASSQSESLQRKAEKANDAAHRNGSTISNNGECPSSYFLEQPHYGPESAYCGYYALCNYMAMTFNLTEIVKKTKNYYMTELGFNEMEAEEFIRTSGLNVQAFLPSYGITAFTDMRDAINNGRFMAGGSGHWVVFKRNAIGKWWLFDSWSGVKCIGGEIELIRWLTTRNIFTYWG